MNSPNEAPSRSSIELRSWWWLPAAAISCGALFGVPTLFPRLYLLAWIAFVPFLLGLQRCRNAWHAYGFGMLSGVFAYGFSTYWMAEFIHLYREYSYPHSISLASIYWLYCAQAFGIVAVITHYAQRANAVLWVFPATLALALAFYPALFPWQLGNSQSEFLVAIQATDLTGVSGLDFILGLSSVLIAQAIIGRPVLFRRGATAAYALVAGWFIYGVASLIYWDRATTQWETLAVGLVQADEAPSIGRPDPRPGFSLGYPVEMALSEQLATAGADLVIWPELRDNRYYTQPFVQAAYRRQVANLETPLIIQSLEEHDGENGLLNFNTAVLIDDKGNEQAKYRKIKRIAMAEYLPIFENSAVVTNWARRNLGEFFGNFTVGPAPVSFDIGRASIKPLICFEVLFPHFVAASTGEVGGDMFTVQSNNGWFGNTRAPYPHLSASVLRSVENRRPLVHVMNNGLGGVALPSGRLLLRTDHREIAGYLLDVAYRKNGGLTLYSRFPYWFVSALGVALALMLVRVMRKSSSAES